MDEPASGETGRPFIVELRKGAVVVDAEGCRTFGDEAALQAEGSRTTTVEGVAVFDSITIPTETEPGVYTLRFCDATPDGFGLTKVPEVTLQIKVLEPPPPAEPEVQA